MARYRIDEHDESKVLIEVAEVGKNQDQLLEAFGECQAGQCSCPTNEYDKLESMEVEQGEDLIRLRLEPKPGRQLDTSQIAACLDYTTAAIAPSQNDPDRRARPGLVATGPSTLLQLSITRLNGVVEGGASLANSTTNETDQRRGV
jgi:hypothetical protein